MSASTTPAPDIAGCRPATGTPVVIEADAIESTTDDHLRRLKRRLNDANYVPSTLVVEASFDPGCSLTTQSEADRVREYLRAAAYLGAGTVRLDIDDDPSADRIRQTVDALRERAEREGLALKIDGPDAHDLSAPGPR